MVQRSRARGVEQARAIVEATQRLIGVKGGSFTTNELAKEAGIALQTFYRYFEGKDQLILAVLEQMVAETSAAYKEAARELDDPLARLHSYITSVVMELTRGEAVVEGARFLTAEHWRLQCLYPAEVTNATKPFTDLVQEEIEEAADRGLLRPVDTAHSAWLVTQLLMGVFHHYAFCEPDEPYEAIAERLWGFCATGLGVNEPERPNMQPRVEAS
jgi:AcrR family transcriptional regulator